MDLRFKEKMRSWMPSHFREGDYDLFLDVATLAFEDLKKNIDDTFKETRISEANTEFLDVHGRERGIERVVYGSGDSAIKEPNRDYSNRVRRIKYNRTKQNIILNVQSVLGLTSVEVMNDSEASSFFEGVSDKRSQTVNLGGVTYGNYGPLDLKLRHNCFSVLLETPIPDPLAFYDDNYFFDDGAFMDERARTVDEIIVQIVKTLVKQKAPAGSGFRLLVKGFTGIDVGNESAQEADLNRR